MKTLSRRIVAALVACLSLIVIFAVALAGRQGTRR
jgi:hypothetical protein